MSEETRGILARTAKTVLPSPVVRFLKRGAGEQTSAAPHVNRGGTYKVLLMSNCATRTYAKVLKRLCPSASVTFYEDRVAVRDRAKFLKDAAASDAVFLMPMRRESAVQDGVDESKIIDLPPFFFSGYHPDTVYMVKPDSKSFTTRFGAYHSSLCYLAHQAGLGVEDTVSLFNEQTYRDMEFFAAWQSSRENLLGAFTGAGLPIDQMFRRWARNGCFMHTVNHPHAHVFVDIAGLAATKLPVERREVDLPVPDALANGAIYPCYPEIAEANGCRGGYYFKPVQSDELMTLTEFVAMCHEAYSQCPHGSLRIRGWRPRKSKIFEDKVLGRFGG